MSFMVILQTLKGNEETFFERAIVERLFAPYVHDLSGDEWAIHWPDGGACLAQLFIDDAPMISSFSVQRPPDFVEFWDAMFQVMKETGTLLVWPGEPFCCVADAAVLDELPEGFVEEAIKRGGSLPVVSSGQELWDVIESS
jgi:hypothetical protein